MNKYLVRNPVQALDYLLDCNLATVSSMAMMKSRSKSEYKRQIEIAQTNYNWLVDFGNELKEFSSRAQQVCDKYAGSVEWWAEQYDVLKYK